MGAQHGRKSYSSGGHKQKAWPANCVLVWLQPAHLPPFRYLEVAGLALPTPADALYFSHYVGTPQGLIACAAPATAGQPSRQPQLARLGAMSLRKTIHCHDLTRRAPGRQEYGPVSA
jgi:hypothetical protein